MLLWLRLNGTTGGGPVVCTHFNNNCYLVVSYISLLTPPPFPQPHPTSSLLTIIVVSYLFCLLLNFVHSLHYSVVGQTESDSHLCALFLVFKKPKWPLEIKITCFCQYFFNKPGNATAFRLSSIIQKRICNFWILR